MSALMAFMPAVVAAVLCWRAMGGHGVRQRLARGLDVGRIRQGLKTVAVRVVMVRLYFGAGRSVFAVALLHGLSNVAAFALPMYGATYDPVVTAVATALLAAVLWMLAGRRAPTALET